MTCRTRPSTPSSSVLTFTQSEAQSTPTEVLCVFYLPQLQTTTLILRNYSPLNGLCP